MWGSLLITWSWWLGFAIYIYGAELSSLSTNQGCNAVWENNGTIKVLISHVTIMYKSFLVNNFTGKLFYRDGNFSQVENKLALIKMFEKFY